MAKTTKTYNNHILVPKHEKLSDKQKKEVLQQYNCTIDKIPKIKIKDPAIKDLSPKAGDMFRIERAEEKSIFYRVVVDE